MFSLNLANVAITSALAIMPLSFSEQGYDNVQSSVMQSETSLMKPELRETVIVAETLLATFYQIASQDYSVFERLDKADLVAVFTQSENLAKALGSHFSAPKDVLLLERFVNTLEKANQLYQAVEYKKEADSVLLSRADSPANTVISAGMNREEIRLALLR